MAATLGMRRLPLQLRRSLRWRNVNRTRFTFPEPLEEERVAAAAARELSGRSSHAESAAGPGSNFISFCREQKLGPRQGAPQKGERWAAEAALEQRLGRKLDDESWVTRGWVMGVPPETPPPSTGAGQPVPSGGEQRRRALTDFAMGVDVGPPGEAAAPASAAPPKARSVADGVAERRRALAEFCLTPRQMKAKLDEVVIAQDNASRAATPACNPTHPACNPALPCRRRAGRGEARARRRAVQPLPLRPAMRPMARGGGAGPTRYLHGVTASST